MLFIVVAIAFLAAANAAHITTVQDVNKLIDKTIVEIAAHKKVPIPELNGAEIRGLEHLHRDGNCVKTAAAGAFVCKAIATEAIFAAEGETAVIALHITFSIVVDEEGKLLHYKLDNVEIVPKDEVTVFYSFKSIIKKVGDAVKKGAEAVVKAAANALGLMVQQKVQSIVTDVAGSIVG